MPLRVVNLTRRCRTAGVSALVCEGRCLDVHKYTGKKKTSGFPIFSTSVPSKRYMKGRFDAMSAVLIPQIKGKKKAMSSNLDSSLTSMDWLPQLGISSLRSGRERRRSGERDRKKDRGRERGDVLPSVPDPSSSSSKGKPPHSYATLIAMAIAAAPERKLSLNDIYTWISNTFPYYSRAGRGWKVGFTDITCRPTCARSSN